jgi:DNA polymerase III alpha subunit
VLLIIGKNCSTARIRANNSIKINGSSLALVNFVEAPAFAESHTVRKLPHNRSAVAAGCVIIRQRPGTAKGLIFLTMEGKTGHANVIVMPDVYSLDPMVVLHERFVQVKGSVQNQDGVVHLRAERISPLSVSAAATQSHDFH